ncbi:rCG49179, partial [Rattus norvegicus]
MSLLLLQNSCLNEVIQRSTPNFFLFDLFKLYSAFHRGKLLPVLQTFSKGGEALNNILLLPHISI